MRSLSVQVVQEQIRLWNERGTSNAKAEMSNLKLVVGRMPNVGLRNAVAKRFDEFCDMLGIQPARRLPRGTMTRFIQEHLALSGRGAKGKEQERKTAGKDIVKESRLPVAKLNVRERHKAWQKERFGGETAVAAKSLMKSLAPRTESHRMRKAGGGADISKPRGLEKPSMSGTAASGSPSIGSK